MCPDAAVAAAVAVAAALSLNCFRDST